MAERLVKNITSDYLTCSICCGIYSDPKMLQCGHSFCSRCLEDYITSILAARDAFECPICRSKYDVEPDIEPKTWIDRLITDDISLSILQAIGIQNTAHSNKDIDSNANVDDPEQINETVFSINSYCGRHFNKKLEVYCSKHDVVVCAECAWRDHRDSECDCLPAARVIEKRHNALKCLVAQQVTDASQLIDTKGSKQNSKTVEQLHDDFQKSITEVEESFKEVCVAFSKKIEHLRVKAKQTISRDTSIVSLGELQTKIVQQIKSFDDVASNMNPNETMRLISEMCSSSSELQENIHDLSNKINTGSLMNYVDTDINLLDAFVSSTKQTLPEDFLSYDEIVKVSDSDEKDFVMVTKSGQFLDEPNDADPETVDWSTHHTFSAKLDSEKSCMLSGIALIGTVAVIVVDQTNRSLKKFKIPEGKFLNDLKIKYEPHQIALIKETNIVAVTVWDVPKVLIVGSDPVLEILRVVNTDIEYIGVISPKVDSLAASSIHARKVDILDIRPSNIQNPKIATIYQSSRKRSFPDRLTCTRNGRVVVRVRHRNEISCFGGYHDLLWSRRLKTRIADVACFRGKIFATLRDKNEIVYFREDSMGPLITLKKDGDSGIRRPWSIDGFKDCLAVTEDSPSDLIHLFVF